MIIHFLIQQVTLIINIIVNVEYYAIPTFLCVRLSIKMFIGIYLILYQWWHQVTILLELMVVMVDYERSVFLVLFLSFMISKEASQ